jgi:lipoyl(octanoyl) transferase
MSISFPCRLLVDPPQSGPWNMAVDEALLHDAAISGTASLRFYGWNEPTLSLGYFQKHADRAQHPASSSVALVRRQSGGGAILHDHELTYSLALPPSHPFAVDAHSLYNAVHELIAALLRKSLLPGCDSNTIRLVGKVQETKKGSEPFLCFQRRSPGDIVFVDQMSHGVADDHKVVGSAQRRSRGAVLQHGSILLGRSEYGPELAGLNDLCDNNIIKTHLSNKLSTALSHSLGLEYGEQAIDDRIRESARSLQEEKYGNPTWILKN